MLQLCSPPAAHDLDGSAVDGRTLRGSKRQGAVDVHLLSAFSQRLGVGLGQTGVPDKTTAIGAAGACLAALALTGRVVTADALLTQQPLAQTLLDCGGEYPLVVKDNQSQVRAASGRLAPGGDSGAGQRG